MLSTRPHSTTKVWARDMVTELWVLASNHTSTRTALLELRHWQLRSKIGATHLSDYLACNYAFNITFDQILKLGPEGLVNSTIVQQPLKIGLMSYEGIVMGSCFSSTFCTISRHARMGNSVYIPVFQRRLSAVNISKYKS